MFPKSNFLAHAQSLHEQHGTSDCEISDFVRIGDDQKTSMQKTPILPDIIERKYTTLIQCETWCENTFKRTKKRGNVTIGYVLQSNIQKTSVTL